MKTIGSDLSRTGSSSLLLGIPAPTEDPRDKFARITGYRPHPHTAGIPQYGDLVTFLCDDIKEDDFLPEVRGLTMDMQRGRIVSSLFPKHDIEVATELPEDDNLLYVQGSEGMMITVTRLSGRNCVGNKRRLDCSRSSWMYKQETFGQYFDEVGGTFEGLFDEDKDHSCYTHLFILVHPHLTTVTKECLDRGYLLYLGARRMWDEDNSPYPVETVDFELREPRGNVRMPKVLTRTEAELFMQRGHWPDRDNLVEGGKDPRLQFGEFVFAFSRSEAPTPWFRKIVNPVIPEGLGVLVAHYCSPAYNFRCNETFKGEMNYRSLFYQAKNERNLPDAPYLTSESLAKLLDKGPLVTVKGSNPNRTQAGGKLDFSALLDREREQKNFLVLLLCCSFPLQRDFLVSRTRYEEEYRTMIETLYGATYTRDKLPDKVYRLVRNVREKVPRGNKRPSKKVLTEMYVKELAGYKAAGILPIVRWSRNPDPEKTLAFETRVKDLQKVRKRNRELAVAV